MPEPTAEPPEKPRPPEGSFSLCSGRYRIVRKIAQGGMASVHLAWDCQQEVWRAVKILLPEFAEREALRVRFAREAQTMAAIGHDNVLRIHDAGVDGDAAYMVMEYAEGGCVTDWIRRHGAMPPRLATEVALQLCQGLAAAHAQGIIHRDVKPENLLLDAMGNCKVADFGIAQVGEEAGQLTRTGASMGTVGYMAPEQHESAKHIDERADVYSVAATLFTLVTGKPSAHLFMASEEEFGDAPAPLVDFIRRGSQYRRDARYPTVDHAASALLAALGQLPEPPLTTPPLASRMAVPLASEVVPPPLPPKVPWFRVGPGLPGAQLTSSTSALPARPRVEAAPAGTHGPPPLAPADEREGERLRCRSCNGERFTDVPGKARTFQCVECGAHITARGKKLSKAVASSPDTRDQVHEGGPKGPTNRPHTPDSATSQGTMNPPAVFQLTPPQLAAAVVAVGVVTAVIALGILALVGIRAVGDGVEAVAIREAALHDRLVERADLLGHIEALGGEVDELRRLQGQLADPAVSADAQRRMIPLLEAQMLAVRRNPRSVPGLQAHLGSIDAGLRDLRADVGALQGARAELERARSSPAGTLARGLQLTE